MQILLISQSAARPTESASSTTFLFNTGREPGIPVHTGQVCVGSGSECGGTAAEYLCLRGKLHMNLQTNDGFILLLHLFFPPYPAGDR